MIDLVADLYEDLRKSQKKKKKFETFTNKKFSTQDLGRFEKDLFTFYISSKIFTRSILKFRRIYSNMCMI